MGRSSDSPSSRRRAHGITDRVADALKRVPRTDFIQAAGAEEFAPTPSEASCAREPIETMLRALRLTGTERVLEMGSRSGYETALLSQLAREVVSLVDTPDRAQERTRLLAERGCRNVKVIVGESVGAALAHGPFGAALLAAGVVRIPDRILDVLETDGRLVIPLGNSQGQVIELLSKRGFDVHSEALGPCHLPILHGAGDRPSYFPWSG